MKVESIILILLGVIFILMISPVKAQDATISTNGISDATLDIQGFLYVSTSEGDIIKYGREGRKLLSYSSTLSFPVSSIHVAYGSRVIGYYAEIQLLIILDRNLKKLAEYDLLETSLNHPDCISYSDDNMLIIYDNTVHQLIKFDPVQSKVLYITDLSFILKNRNASIRQVEAYHNHIYLMDNEGSLLLFDNLGNYLKREPLNAESLMSFYQNRVLYMHDGRLRVFDLNTGNKTPLDRFDPAPGLIKAVMNEDHVWLIYPDHAKQYQMRD